MSRVSGVTPNFFSSVSPTYMAVNSLGYVFVIAVNEIFVINPYGKVIGKINVPGAEYISYCSQNNTLIVSSGTLPNFTISFISAKNFSIIRTITVNNYPLSVLSYDGRIYVGTYDGVGTLNDNKINIFVKTPGQVVSLAYSNGSLYAVGYNFSQDYGFLFIIHNYTYKSIILNTFPNFVYAYNNKIYIAGDFSIIILNQNSNLQYVNISGEKFEGIVVDPKNNLTYATADSLIGPDYILVLNGSTIEGKIYGGITPIGIVYDNTSNLLFISNFFDGTVSVISTNNTQSYQINTYQIPINQNVISSKPQFEFYAQDIFILLIIILASTLALRKIKK